MPDALATVLDHVVAQLPGGGEPREGQKAMAAAVANAIATGRHLIVQAGTGTGKSLGYLLPAVLSGRRVVVATATKALQDQLAGKDLPFLQSSLPEHPFAFAVLKGRSNYICRQRVIEASSATASQLDLDDTSPQVRSEIRKLARWAETCESGDRAELDVEPMERAWQAVSVTASECPGANSCPQGDMCFSEAARRAAAAADIIVVNLHLYGTHLASGSMVLPEHDLVIIDEAHQIDDTISATAGLELSGGRFTAMGRTLRSVLTADELTASVARSGNAVTAALAALHGERLQMPLPEDLLDALASAREVVNQALDALRGIETTVDAAQQRRLRAQKACTGLAEELALAMEPPKGTVAWVEGERTNPRLRIAPIDIGPILRQSLWDAHPTILTSATIPPAMGERLGLAATELDQLDVGSPFDYASQAVLYCAKHLPDPRNAAFEPAMHDELEALITAAGGRTLALFTSWRAMNAAVDALRPRLPFTLLTQADMPKPALLAAFSADETSCLFATAGLFQGVDIPGRAATLVTIDRIPFPRPDEPLLQARRDLVGPKAFQAVDLPRASTLMAQAAGRLIRTATDRGVVAIFDKRLATAGYRWDLVRALPPMRRTADRSEAERFLREITAD